jgi:hypothetical protein
LLDRLLRHLAESQPTDADSDPNPDEPAPPLTAMTVR